MTEIERKSKKEELLEALKEEIFIELDRRIRATEKSLSQNIHHIEEVIDEKVVNEFAEHVGDFDEYVEKNKKWKKKMKEEVKSMQRRLIYYRIPYSMMVVAGFMLFWYGAVNLIPQIPFLGDAPVAIIAGLILLVATGAFYKKLVD